MKLFPSFWLAQRRAANVDVRNVAFSLTELLVALATVAILAAFLLTAFSKARARVQRIQCVANLHQIGVGLQNCLANNHGYPSTYDRDGSAWFLQIDANGFGISSPGVSMASLWKCPSARWKQTGEPPFSFWYNMDGIWPASNLGLGGRWIVQASRSITFAPVAESAVISPVNMMAIGDSFTGLQGMERKTVAAFEMYGNARSRHQGRGNVLFCDGHVGSPTLQYLFEDTSDEALRHWNRDHQPHRELLP